MSSVAPANDKIESIQPLSPVQHGMLLYNLTEPEQRAYCQQVVWELSGDLSARALEEAWRAAVERHAVLRALFLWGRGKRPVQVVLRRVELPWEVLDWSGGPPAAAEAPERLQELLRSDLERGFDLGRAPLLRLVLIRLAGDRHLFVWSFHHIILDGWSSHLLLQEVFALYAAFKLGRAPQLPPVRPYSEYLTWRERQDPAAAEAFWQRELAGFSVPTPLAFGAAPGEPAARAAEGAVGAAGAGKAGDVMVEIPSAVSAALNAAARRHRVTVSTFVQAAWALLLARTAGTGDVLFGLTVSGRPAELPGVSSMVGLFINTLPLRVHVDFESPLLDWLQEVQARQFHLQRFDYAPLVDIQGWSEVPRGLPLFDSILASEGFHVGQPFGDAAELAGGLALRELGSHDRTNYPLSLMAGLGERMGLRVIYDPRRFEAAAMARLLAHLGTLLARLGQGVEGRVADLSPVSSEERHQLLIEWNDARRPLAGEAGATLDAGFAGWAARRPDGVAVVAGGEVVTYGALAERAGRLARALSAAGLREEEPVALYLDRSPAVVAAMLGTLAAGGAYLPLDPGHPRERLARLWENAGRPLVVCEGRRVPDFAAAARVLSLDGPAAEAGLPPRAAGGAGLAYVLHTSGSTGEPKGVCCTHRGVVNLLADFERHQPLAPGSRGSVWASLGFDASVYEIFSLLLTGGSIHLVPEEIRNDTERFLDWLAEERIENAYLPPFLVAELRRRLEAAPESIPLRRLMVGVEPIPEAWLARIAALRPELAVINAYGPTEAAICATLYDVDPEKDRPGAPAITPIGRPVANTAVYLLDSRLAPVPVDAPGELYLGGAGLARGYLSRPEATAERFVPHPWSEEPGGRLYRTGDVARFQADGNLEFLGRVDHQIKLRGLRIELGEIEAVLGLHPRVLQTAVVVREGKRGKLLVAFVVLDPAGGEPAGKEVAAELRGFLRERLPESMVPSSFVALPALPQTPHGKTDRKALASLALDDPTAAEGSPEGFVAPRGETEEILAALWGDLLGVEPVGRHDHFFESGGHSLLAARLITRVREVFGREIPQRALFEEPTLAGLAAQIDAAGPAGELAPIVRVPGEGPFPLSFAQERLWMNERLRPGESTYNLPVALRLRGRLEVAALAAGLTEVVRRHEPLRTTYRFARTAGRTDGQPVQVVGPPPQVTIPVVDLAELPEDLRGEEGWWLVAEEAEEPFDLAAGPVFRVLLLRLRPEEHVLVLSVHHIATDGWSNAVLVREVVEVYRALGEGRPPELPPLPVRYIDYAACQRESLTEAVLAAGIDTFRTALAGTEPLELPVDQLRPAALSSAGSAEEVRLPAELAEGLVRLCRQQGVTLFMGLSALFSTLLHRLTGQTDFALGTVAAGRNRLELEELIGFFINSLPLAVHIADEPSFTGFLARTREVALAAFACQQVPFERLVEELAPERNPAQTPLVQALCVLQNMPVAEASLPGLTLSPVLLDSTTAKFDLTLTVAALPAMGGLLGALEYRSDLFEPTTICRWIGHLETLLAAVVEDPSRSIAELPLLSEAERQELAAERAQGEAVDPGSQET